MGDAGTDWVRWHEAYDRDPSLARRLVGTARSVAEPRPFAAADVRLFTFLPSDPDAIAGTAPPSGRGAHP